MHTHMCGNLPLFVLLLLLLFLLLLLLWLWCAAAKRCLKGVVDNSVRGLNVVVAAAAAVVCMRERLEAALLRAASNAKAWIQLPRSATTSPLVTEPDKQEHGDTQHNNTANNTASNRPSCRPATTTTTTTAAHVLAWCDDGDDIEGGGVELQRKVVSSGLKLLLQCCVVNC